MNSIGIALFFIILGIVIKYGKMYFLIAGYNTLSKVEKAKYDIAGIATVFRNGMFGMALLLVVGSLLADWLKDPRIESYSTFATIIIGVAYLLIKSNSKKFKVEDNKTKN